MYGRRYPYGSRFASAQWDKRDVSILKVTLGDTPATTELSPPGSGGTDGFNRALTVRSVRWSLAFSQDGGSGIARGKWMIIKVEEGDSVNTVNLGDGVITYEPEQAVLAFGDWAIDNGTQTKTQIGETSAKRKMKVGDRLVFVARGTDTNTTQINGTVQFFTKE